MSSRSKRYSSESYFQPQTKRLSTDESEEYKKSVYEKTMQKLKEGAKLNTAPRSIVDVVTPTKSSASQSELKRGLKQISLNSNCQLESDTKITNTRDYCSALPEYCSYCDRLGCFTSLNQCNKCKEHFCSNCSFSTFLASEENYVCKSCLR